jgi:hypothetical protein
MQAVNEACWSMAEYSAGRGLLTGVRQPPFKEGGRQRSRPPPALGAEQLTPDQPGPKPETTVTLSHQDRESTQQVKTQHLLRSSLYFVDFDRFALSQSVMVSQKL